MAERGALRRDGNQAMGGRNGGAAVAAGTSGVSRTGNGAIPGITLPPANGTASITLGVDRQWQPVWQQSPCPAGAEGEDWVDTAWFICTMPSQCASAAACAGCIAAAPCKPGAPNANPAHASSAATSRTRENRARVRNNANIWRD